MATERIFLSMLSIVLAGACAAQPVITDADLDRERERYRTPSAAELDAAAPSIPNIESLPKPAGTQEVDIEALARRFEANRERIAGAQGLMTGPSLLVFVSLTMPEPALVRLAAQAARAHAVLLLRGFENGSLKQTMTHVRRLIGTQQVAWQIDPQAFDRFAVSKAPTFVLVRGGVQAQQCGEATCLPPGAYVSVAGDVSLDYALDFIARTAPRFGHEANGFLDKLRVRAP
ncbi:type-F conjugative transfer system pilin assembly protein TrbC [Actimicrobium sp. CCI2.3]|uniref:type-F conjugative transfer system pilin assembly protein TrbC n=1 Tax=Actimicrobium sp. CCI2.3 TaxID=3048616 RepID=UPI002AB3BEC4|nr:type-F conjugative transfer system pilin assembly protein TrbC [Actimicrobium sp. CCI2.3]MDY7574447.1 type-F conjugative transfer system pilin assembly protein TrbC [Actimicrobium sp. CCI2.3]MEB0022475.1 type-F conjugative transfer system pilin assembly protein TrbC [Actimicrobium sp. CCI2.3]